MSEWDHTALTTRSHRSTRAFEPLRGGHFVSIEEHFELRDIYYPGVVDPLLNINEANASWKEK